MDKNSNDLLTYVKPNNKNTEQLDFTIKQIDQLNQQIAKHDQRLTTFEKSARNEKSSKQSPLKNAKSNDSDLIEIRNLLDSQASNLKTLKHEIQTVKTLMTQKIERLD